MTDNSTPQQGTMQSTIAPSELEMRGIMRFLQKAGQLKDTPRSAFTNAGDQESAAEHSWRLALFVIVLGPYMQGLDTETLLRMAVVHDLGEAITGDVPAIHQGDDSTDRHELERQAILDLIRDLPSASGSAVKHATDEYDNASSAEALFLKGLDKLETIHQHATGQNPPDFDYAFNLTYGARWTGDDPLLVALRAILDSMTKQRQSAQSVAADLKAKGE